MQHPSSHTLQLFLHHQPAHPAGPPSVCAYSASPVAPPPGPGDGALLAPPSHAQSAPQAPPPPDSTHQHVTLLDIWLKVDHQQQQWHQY